MSDYFEPKVNMKIRRVKNNTNHGIYHNITYDKVYRIKRLKEYYFTVENDIGSGFDTIPTYEYWEPIVEKEFVPDKEYEDLYEDA